MPAASTPPSHFRVIQKLKLDYSPVTITQYESTRTGMRVAVVDQKGPKVNGYFALATEILDDSGAPHTLEHLCFMGSKSYRYKGLLDKLATRAYSTTNAWTATEQTAYTLDTAGWAGFAQILPVYLEHVIVPTLTDAGCYTEVHHIDGTGHDAGVVYSEMQGVQNSQSELMALRAKRLLFPEGNGFRYETGGMMEALRVLTADRIRAFHKEMYQPKNLCVVLTGEIDHDELLEILDRFEDTIVDDVPSMDAPFRRPWVESTPIPMLDKTIVETVPFPEEDESMGEVLVGWHGPDVNNNLDCQALEILLTYLCGSSIAVLENILVEKEQLCSMIYYSIEARTRVTLWFSMSAVETEKLQEVRDRLLELLRETADKELDMPYLHECIARSRRQIKLRCESAGFVFADPIIEDHLFGDRDGSDLKKMSNLEEFDILEKWADRQWRDFLIKWVVGAPSISILGQPSQALSKKITEDEKSRVKAQQDRLGEEGLQKLAEKLKDAQAENDAPIPDSVLEQFPIPEADSIHFIPTTTARAGSARKLGKLDNKIQEIVDRDDDHSPLFFHFEDIPSNFVTVRILMGTSLVPLKLKPLLSLYLNNFFTTPFEWEGKRVEFEDLVLGLEKDTVAYDIAMEYGNVEMMTVGVQLEPEKYESVILWLRKLFYAAIHDPERLFASLTKILAEIPEEKRSGSQMVGAVNTMMLFQPSSSVRACDTLSKGLYLKRVKKLLKTDPEAVQKQMAELVQTLHQPENFRIYVSGNISKLPNPVSTWKTLLHNSKSPGPLRPLDDRRALLSPIGANPGSAAYIVPLATIDSSYAVLTGRGPGRYDDPDLPALMVAKSYFDAVEGPLWVAVRGTGLAYGTYFGRSTELGHLRFHISRSPDSWKAFCAAREQVEGYGSGRLALDRFALEGAVSENVLALAEEQPTMATAAAASFDRQVLRGLDKDWAHRMLVRVRAVTPEEVKAVMRKWFLPVFDPARANLVVVCAKIMKEDLLKNFEKEKFEVKERTLESFQDAYGMEPEDGEDDDEDEDGKDDDDDDDDDEEDDEE